MRVETAGLLSKLCNNGCSEPTLNLVSDESLPARQIELIQILQPMVFEALTIKMFSWMSEILILLPNSKYLILSPQT